MYLVGLVALLYIFIIVHWVGCDLIVVFSSYFLVFANLFPQETDSLYSQLIGVGLFFTLEKISLDILGKLKYTQANDVKRTSYQRLYKVVLKLCACLI